MVTNLDVSGNLIDDELIEQISQSFPHLEILHLNRTRIGRVGLQQSTKLRKLNEVYLYGTSVNADDLTLFSQREARLMIHIEKEKIPKEYLSSWSNGSHGVMGKLILTDDRGLKRDNKGKAITPSAPRPATTEGDSFHIWWGDQ